MTRTEASRPDEAGTRVENWMHDISYTASVVRVVHTEQEIQHIVTNKSDYPPPVRAKGSHHSTTRCIEAERGTVVDVSEMRKIVSIDTTRQLLTTEPGILAVDAAKELEKKGWQLFFNAEIGSMTLGAAAVAASKDASVFANGVWEFGQASSYCVGMRIITADGSVRNVTEEEDPGLMRALRSSYGLLGIVVQVSFRIKPLQLLRFRHMSFDVDKLERDRSLETLIEQNVSVMLYIFPIQRRVVAELREVVDGDAGNLSGLLKKKNGGFSWKVRNFSWQYLRPVLANLLSYLPVRPIRNFFTNLLNSFTVFLLTTLLRGRASLPADQIIRFSESAGLDNFTFSFWAFPLENYAATLRRYCDFVREYDRDNGYRCDLLALGYHVTRDDRALFSYSPESSVLTIDPGASGRTGWRGFLAAYNEFCSQNGGRPMFNQTAELTPLQAKKAFEKPMTEFLEIRKEMDPDDRFLNGFFKNLFSEAR